MLSQLFWTCFVNMHSWSIWTYQVYNLFLVNIVILYYCISHVRTSSCMLMSKCKAYLGLAYLLCNICNKSQLSLRWCSTTLAFLNIIFIFSSFASFFSSDYVKIPSSTPNISYIILCNLLQIITALICKYFTYKTIGSYKFFTNIEKQRLTSIKAFT